VPLRALLVLVAVLAATWLGVQAVGSAALEDATALAFRTEPPPTREEIAEALDRLDRAERLNTDVRPLLARGVLLARRGDREAAAAAYREATRRAPENVEAWGLLADAARGREAQEALARARRLAPPVPAP
jgi:cytochrome c-type biogenesis protein CcmH/NrfG